MAIWNHNVQWFSRMGFILLMGLLLAREGRSQTRWIENGQWFSASISQDVKDFKWSFEQNLRLRNGLFIVSNYFSEAGLGYKLNKYVSLKAKYRLGVREPQVDRFLFQRVNLDVNLEYKLKKTGIEFRYRPRIQVRFRKQEGFWEQNWVLRNRFDVRYKIDKTFRLWGAGELFHRLNETGRTPFQDEMRAFLGLDIDVGKRQELSVYYMYSHEMNISNPISSHTIGVKYDYELKKWKKKKKKD